MGGCFLNFLLGCFGCRTGISPTGQGETKQLNIHCCELTAMPQCTCFGFKSSLNVTDLFEEDPGDGEIVRKN